MKRIIIAAFVLLLLAGCAKQHTDQLPPEQPAVLPAETPLSAALESQTIWELRLVNRENLLTADFVPVLIQVQGKFEMDARVAPFMEEMLAAAKQQGITLEIISAYRSYEKQQQNIEAKIAEYRSLGFGGEEAEEQTLRLIALPGASEHQSGLAADILTPAYQRLDDGYAETDAAKWLLENAADYGFILRYPKDKTAITEFHFEPWHYRYVGIEAARDIMSAGICLEEYLQ